jgi:hypothetical protein
VQHHRPPAARRDDEALLPAEQGSARLRPLRVLLVLLQDVGETPRLGFDRVVAARDGGGHPARLPVPFALVGDLGDGGEPGQVRCDRVFVVRGRRRASPFRRPDARAERGAGWVPHGRAGGPDRPCGRRPPPCRMPPAAPSGRAPVADRLGG